jgi:hypothetical protein
MDLGEGLYARQRVLEWLEFIEVKLIPEPLKKCLGRGFFSGET